MLLQPALPGAWLGIQATLIYRVVGAGPALFSVELFFQALRPRVSTWRALLASIADFLWVGGSLALLVAVPELFSNQGNILVLATAGVVQLFGLWQLWAAGRAHRSARNGEYRHCIVVETNAPADRMWRIVGDLGKIENYMPSLKYSTLLEDRDPGVGAVRACENQAGQQWQEECIEYIPGRSFSVRFLAEAPGFPFPVKSMRGGWEVNPTDGGSQVMIWWELKPIVC